MVFIHVNKAKSKRHLFEKAKCDNTLRRGVYMIANVHTRTFTSNSERCSRHTILLVTCGIS